MKINKKNVDCGVDIQLISPGDEVFLIDNTDEVNWKRMYLNKVAHKKNVERNLKNNNDKLRYEIIQLKEMIEMFEDDGYENSYSTIKSENEDLRKIVEDLQKEIGNEDEVVFGGLKVDLKLAKGNIALFKTDRDNWKKECEDLKSNWEADSKKWIMTNKELHKENQRLLDEYVYKPDEEKDNLLKQIKDLEENIEYLNDKCDNSTHKDEGNPECDMWIEEATKQYYLADELKEDISLIKHNKDIEINKLKEKIEELEKIGQTKNEYRYKKMLEGNRKKYNYMLAKLNNLKKCSTPQEVMLLMEDYDGRGNRLSEYYGEIEKKWIEVRKLYEIMAEFYECDDDELRSLQSYIDFAFYYGDEINKIVCLKDFSTMKPKSLNKPMKLIKKTPPKKKNDAKLQKALDILGYDDYEDKEEVLKSLECYINTLFEGDGSESASFDDIVEMKELYNDLTNIDF